MADSLRILFIGGTGLISSDCLLRALGAGHDVTLVNRGRSTRATTPPGVRTLHVDVSDRAALAATLGAETYDVVVNWIAFTPDQVEADLATFTGRTAQYVFISSASAYTKPRWSYLVTEETPLANPFWQYSRDKIACEEVLTTQAALPWTIVRPSHTYGPSSLPLAVSSWDHPYTVVDRMLRGAPVIVPGDGTSIWTITHTRDFAVGFTGLLGNPRALGRAFHITSDDAPSWNSIYETVATAAGVPLERFHEQVVHVPTDGLVAADDWYVGPLRGDAIHSSVFDNSAIRELVPDFAPSIPFSQGAAEGIAWFDADPSRRTIDVERNAAMDRVAAVYTEALRGAGEAARTR